MKARCQSRATATLLIIASLGLISTTVSAAETATAKTTTPPAQPAPPTREMREKMAVIHEKAAACLRSDKPVSDCHEEMKKACHDAGPHTCGGMMDHHKMMKRDDADEHTQHGTMPPKP